MPVGHCEPRFSGLGLAVAAHPETREPTGRGYKIEVSLSDRLDKLQATDKRIDGFEIKRHAATGRGTCRLAIHHCPARRTQDGLALAQKGIVTGEELLVPVSPDCVGEYNKKKF